MFSKADLLWGKEKEPEATHGAGKAKGSQGECAEEFLQDKAWERQMSLLH